MKMNDADRPFLAPLIHLWGMKKVEKITGFTRNTIYQWKPSRGSVPPEVALRIAQHPEALQLGFWVETVCPGLPWSLVYRGPDRRTNWNELDLDLEETIKAVGVSAVARAINRSRQNIYEAMKADRCPVWLALAIELASEQHYLVEDFRPDLPWWVLYNRHSTVVPVARDETENERVRQQLKKS